MCFLLVLVGEALTVLIYIMFLVKELNLLNERREISTVGLGFYLSVFLLN